MLIKSPSRAESVPSAPRPCGLASVSCTVPRVVLRGLRLWDLLGAASAGPRAQIPSCRGRGSCRRGGDGLHLCGGRQQKG